MPSTFAMIESAICCTELNSLSVRTRKRCVPCSRRPPERLTFSSRRRCAICVDRKVELRQLLLVHEDLDLVLVAAADLDRGRSVHGLEVRLQPVVGKAAQPLQPLDAAGLAGVGLGEFVGVDEGVAHHRLGRRVESQQDRAARLERQLQQVDLFAHVDAREVHVRAPRELEDHVRLACARHRADRPDVPDDARRIPRSGA